MRCFVTGPMGFIGCQLVETLLSRGHSVIGLDKITYAANEERTEDLLSDPGYRLFEGDCANISTVSKLLSDFHPDCVIHMAAESHVDRSISGPQTFIEANVLGTYGVLEAIREYMPAAPHNFRLIHVSTDEVFGDMPLDCPDPFHEQSPYRPSSPYSVSKASSDWLVRAWGRTYGVPWVITHGANTYGPHQLPDKLVPMTIHNTINGFPITLHGSGANVRSWIHVSDHADAIIAVMLMGQKSNNYCIDAGMEISNAGMIEMITSEMSLYNPVVLSVPDRPGNDMRYAMSSDKIKSHTKWQPKIELTEGLRETIQWFINKENDRG